ncbi:hypothetical protein HYX03_01110 [Candidatus Woesearchaeota archaeon]|nr:hypothetical protein [Candidatus Woesearchaeota archaeon]
MKNLIIIFSILLLFLPIAAAETKIFAGTVITDTDKAIDGSTFRFTYDENSNKVFVQTPATGLIVENGACKSNPVFRVCIERANFSYKNITTYVYYYEIYATIYKLTGSLSATSKATSNTLLQGESAELTVTITNPTEFDITNILFNYGIANFSIKEVKGCVLDGNQLTWQGSLQPKAGNLSYFNGFETEKKITDAVAITVLPKQLKASQIVDKDVEVKQPFYLNMSLQNINKDEKIDVLIAIELPSNTNILRNTPDFSKEFNMLKRSLTLEPNSFFNYSLYLEASSEGSNPIEQSFAYAIKGISDKIENYTFINAVEPKLLLNFSAEYPELMPGQKFIVVAKLKNPSRIYALTGIKARLDATENNEIEQSLDKLVPNESYTIISNTLIAQKNLIEESGNKTIELNLTVEYNFMGVVKTLNKSIELKLKSFNGTTANISTRDNSQIQQETKMEETVAKTQSDNKTAEKVITITEKPKPGFFNRKTLKISAIVLAVIAAIVLIMYIVISLNAKGKFKGKPEQDKAIGEIEEQVKKL